MFFDQDTGGISRFTLLGRVRRACPEDMNEILTFGYDTWGEGKDLETFFGDYRRGGDAFRDTWFIFERPDGVSCAKLKTIRFSKTVAGFASISTTPSERGKGYASLLTQAVMEILSLEIAEPRFLLFSEVSPAIYERLGFQVLPDELQLFKPSLAMATGALPLCSKEEEFFKVYF